MLRAAGSLTLHFTARICVCLACALALYLAWHPDLAAQRPVLDLSNLLCISHAWALAGA